LWFGVVGLLCGFGVVGLGVQVRGYAYGFVSLGLWVWDCGFVGLWVWICGFGIAGLGFVGSG
jgi:hypothetical protein